MVHSVNDLHGRAFGHPTMLLDREAGPASAATLEQAVQSMAAHAKVFNPIPVC